MKHATPATLERISALLDQIRQKDVLQEKRLGVFYRKSKAFLHFHEDLLGIFADLRTGLDFERLPVNTPLEKQKLLSTIDRILKPKEQLSHG